LFPYTSRRHIKGWNTAPFISKLALDGGQWSARAPAALPSENVSPATVRWALIGSQNLSDYYVEVKIILHLLGIEPRFIGYQYGTNSTHETICVVLCHVAIA
jgi:hypothetical protein